MSSKHYRLHGHAVQVNTAVSPQAAFGSSFHTNELITSENAHAASSVWNLSDLPRSDWFASSSVIQSQVATQFLSLIRWRMLLDTCIYCLCIDLCTWKPASGFFDRPPDVQTLLTLFSVQNSFVKTNCDRVFREQINVFKQYTKKCNVLRLHLQTACVKKGVGAVICVYIFTGYAYLLWAGQYF